MYINIWTEIAALKKKHKKISKLNLSFVTGSAPT